MTRAGFTLPGCFRCSLEPPSGDRGCVTHLYSATGGGGGSFCSGGIFFPEGESSDFGEAGCEDLGRISPTVGFRPKAKLCISRVCGLLRIDNTDVGDSSWRFASLVVENVERPLAIGLS